MRTVPDRALRVLPDDPRLRAVIGKRVRYMRQQKDWSQRQLAQKANVTPNTLRGLEKGTLATRWTQFLRVAQALGVTATQLIEQAQAEPLVESPLTQNLLTEDLQMAQLYHHSSTDVRRRAQNILAHPEYPAPALPDDADVLAIARRLADLAPAHREIIDRIITSYETIERDRPARKLSRS